MAQINKPTDYFNTKLYTGNGTDAHAITGVGFSPDFVWLKGRSVAEHHTLNDSVRGANKQLYSNLTYGEATDTDRLQSFDSDGFTLGTDVIVNQSSQTFVSWNWLAGGTGSSNTDGSITSTVSANTTSGFSIVSYTGTGANATVGHGLGVAPKVVIIKDRENSTAWLVGGDAIGTTDNNYLLLNTTDDLDTASTGFQSFSTTTVGLGSDTWFNGSSTNYIAYCFAEKKGFSKFGKFTSNGSDDGTFTYCGFKPAWVMMKANVTDGWSHWYIFDTKRDVANITDSPLYANLTTAEGYYGGSPATNYSQIDMLSNGFKMRRDGNWGLGGSGTEVIYMAFAEAPLVGTNNIPATAR